MYLNTFESSVTLSNIAFALQMYSNIDVSLIDAIVDYYGFVEDMSSM